MPRVKSYRIAVISLMACLAFSPHRAQAQQDKVINFEKTDPEMNAAIAKARSSLPDFWQRFAHHGPEDDDFELKIAIAQDSKTEHLWCGEIEGSAGKATCIIRNRPEVISTVSIDERINVDNEHISDWMYRHNHKIKGAETFRVMIQKLPIDEQAEYRAMLSDE